MTARRLAATSLLVAALLGAACGDDTSAALEEADVALPVARDAAQPVGDDPGDRPRW